MSTRPPVVRTRAELTAALGPARGEPGRRRRAAVLTMGALHEGHLSLVRTAREHADQVVVTVFVNPLQFGPGEDLERYPRDLDRDVELLGEAGADLVFAPPVQEVYRDGEPVVRVSAGALGQRYEGEQRPGHFDGVLTVVLKLLHLTGPDVTVFGRKDAQQLIAVRRMVRDLDVPVEVVAAPTVRDTDGVALSSRNVYLSPEQRVAARVLYQSLVTAEQAALRGGRAPEVHGAAADVLAAEPGVVVDYVALVDPTSGEDVAADHHGAALLAVAARLGPTRLLDNTTVLLGGEAR